MAVNRPQHLLSPTGELPADAGRLPVTEPRAPLRGLPPESTASRRSLSWTGRNPRLPWAGSAGLRHRNTPPDPSHPRVDRSVRTDYPSSTPEAVAFPSLLSGRMAGRQSPTKVRESAISGPSGLRGPAAGPLWKRSYGGREWSSGCRPSLVVNVIEVQPRRSHPMDRPEVRIANAADILSVSRGSPTSLHRCSNRRSPSH